MAVTQWELKSTSLDLKGGAIVMGIVNATPDSFSDGGAHFDSAKAIDRALSMANHGVRIIDVGGESTRPYSTPVDVAEELRRVIPVIEGIAAQSDVPISIDTSKAEVARHALQAGAQIINDVTGLEGDPKMIEVALQFQPGVCAMHMKGTPQTMQDNPVYENVVEDIFSYLMLRKKRLVDSGLLVSRICLDPGVGFGKTHEHNLTLIRQCERYLDLEVPVLIGHSRKGFIGKMLGDKEVERDSATLTLSLLMALKGIHVLRVHDAERTARALRVLQQV